MMRSVHRTGREAKDTGRVRAKTAQIRTLPRVGPWVGGADIARVSLRMGWIADDRCNNIGFRIARSKAERATGTDQE